MPYLIEKVIEWDTWLFKSDARVYLLLLGLVAAISFPRLQGPIDLRWDGGVYYVLGTSMAEGRGYRLLNEPGEIQANQYPPLLPLIVAVYQKVIGTSDPFVVGPWLRYSAIAIFLAYVMATYAFLKRHFPVKIAFAGTVICLFHVEAYFLSDLLYPEILYGLATVCFVLVSHNSCKQISAVVATSLAIAAFGLRTIGIALLVAWVAESVFDKDFKRGAMRLVVALVPFVCWQAYIASVIGGTEYSRPAYDYQRAAYMFNNVSYAENIFALKDSFRPEAGTASAYEILNRLFLNLLRTPQSLGEAVSSNRASYQTPWKMFELPFPISTPWPVDVALLILGSLVVIGVGLQLRRRQWLVPLYVVFSIASMCLTPWPWMFHRYLMPLTPFLVMCLISACLVTMAASGRWRLVAARVMGITGCLILSLQLLTVWGVYSRLHQIVTLRDWQGNQIQYRLFFYSDAYRAFDAGLDWLQGQAKPHEVVAGSMPHWMYLRARVKSIMPPLEVDPFKAQALLDSVPVTYLFLDEGLAVDTKRYMTSVVQQFPDRWEQVYVDTIAPEHTGQPHLQFEIYRRVGLPPTSSTRSMNYVPQPRVFP